ncbi:GNAT family N-acetyltransferase [candidate division KSB1 bacterium]
MVVSDISKITEKELSKDKLEALLEDGFGKSLVGDYFENFSPESIYVIEHDDKYKAAIILERTPLGFAYLDKFVVAKQHHGNGIGKEIWSEMAAQEKRIFWRAKSDNPINKFYASVCDGMQKANGWNVYWVGLNPNELKNAIDYALAKKNTLDPVDE